MDVVLRAGARVYVSIQRAPLEGQRFWVRLLQDGVEVALGGGEQHVPPGPITVALCVIDPETEELVTLDTREVTAVEGERVEVVL